MSALLLACAALCAAVAAMPEASTGVRAEAEPLVAAQGTLIKYAGGPFNTAFISARPGAWHLQAPTWGLTPFVTGFESPATSVVHQRVAMPHTARRRCRAAQASRSGDPGKALSQARAALGPGGRADRCVLLRAVLGAAGLAPGRARLVRSQCLPGLQKNASVYQPAAGRFSGSAV
jgi:hypothetical protein